MTHLINCLADIADQFEVVVLDQWGVLHDGSAPYPSAVHVVRDLAGSGLRLGVLSNSGKRAAINTDRIAAFGFSSESFEVVMTSGEALWRDIDDRSVSARRFFPVEGAHGDAEAFLAGLDAEVTDTLIDADAVLLMGVPDDAHHGAYDQTFETARREGVPVICTNPDRASPRSDGHTVVSPGALAQAHKQLGGEVLFYGKPHLPVFRAIESAFGVSADRIVMVGDSLEHDIAGAANAGWSSVFVRSGLHAAAFGSDDTLGCIAALAEQDGAPMPDFSLKTIGGRRD